MEIRKISDQLKDGFFKIASDNFFKNVINQVKQASQPQAQKPLGDQLKSQIQKKK